MCLENDCRALSLLLCFEIDLFGYGLGVDICITPSLLPVEFNLSKREDVDIKISGLIEASVCALNSVPNFCFTSLGRSL